MNNGNNKKHTGKSSIIQKVKWLHIIGIVLLGLLVYANSLNNGFLHDDAYNIVDNSFIKDWKNLPDLFTNRYFELAQEKTYRPVVTLSYFISYWLFKLNKIGWRIINVLFHLGNAVLVYLLINMVFRNRNIAFIAALLFCLHPVQAEAVNVISFREDLMSLFFFLLSFVFYLKYAREGDKKLLFYVCSLCSFLLAVFTKEMALSLPFVLLLYDYYFNKGKGNRFSSFVVKTIKSPYYPGCLAVVIFFFAQRTWLLKPTGYVFETDISIPAGYMGGSLLTAMFTMARAVVYYIEVLVFPYKLFIGHVFPKPLALSPAVIVSAVILLIIIISAFRLSRRSGEVSFSVFYFFITMIPVSNVIIPTGEIIYERYLYFSSIGFCLLLGLMVMKLKTVRIRGFKLQ